MALGLFKRADGTHACSFCGTPRQAVQVLVAAERVSICERCIVLATTAGNGFEGFHRFELLLRALVDQLEGLAKDGPAEAAEAIARAGVALAMGEPAWLGTLWATAVRLGRFRTALRVMDAVPEASRDAVWALDAILARTFLGDYQGALELADATPGPGFLHGALLRLRRASARLRSEPAPEEAEVRRLLAELEGVERELEGNPAGEADQYRPELVAARARCRLALGEPHAAAALLRGADGPAGLGPDARILLGDALAASGEGEAARREWQRAEQEGWPESVTVRDARERLARAASPYR